jgi:hypothetical protein
MTTTINASTSSGLVQTADNSGILALQTAGTTAVTVTASQIVGVGTTNPTPTNATTSVSKLVVAGSGSNQGIQAVRTVTPGGGGALFLASTTRGSDANSYTALQSGDGIGSLIFTGADGTQQVTSAAIQAQVDGTVSTNNVLGRLAFSTSAGGANAATERMRIDSGGFTYINCTSSVASVPSYSNITFNGVAYFGMSIKTSYAGAGSTFAAFINSAGTQQGSIYANATNTVQFLTSSDYRLKENIAPMTGALAKVSALKPVTYNWKSDGSASQGFIAHELQTVVPECVGGEKDAVDADGNPKYQGVDTSFLVATLTAAIQEQQAIITKLQADVAALKGTTP